MAQIETTSARHATIHMSFRETEAGRLGMRSSSWAA